MRLIIFAIYLGIGAMLHALFIGAVFDWTSAWTFGWLFGWPIMIVLAFWGFILGVALVCIMGWAAWSWLEMIAKWRRGKSNGTTHKA